MKTDCYTVTINFIQWPSPNPNHPRHHHIRHHNPLTHYSKTLSDPYYWKETMYYYFSRRQVLFYIYLSLEDPCTQRLLFDRAPV